MNVSKMRLLTPGPTPIPDRVRLVMAEPMIHHRKAAFKEALAECQTLLKMLFGTNQVVLPLSCSGTGSMVAAVHALFQPGETVLVAEAGKFGERWANIATVRGLKVITHSVPWGQAIQAHDIAALLAQHSDINGVLLQVSETSTGVQHPVREIAALTRSKDVLLVADGISAVGLSPCPMDEWGIDCLLTGSQKGLMVPPGLALIALSERAWAKAATVPPSCFYFNLQQERENCLKNQTLFTSPVSLILALREGLRILFEDDGLPGVYKKQWALTCMARAGIQAMGLKPFAPTNYTWGLTSVAMPAGVTSSAVVKKAAASCGVLMTTGQEPMKDEILRLGHMGWVDWADLAAGLHALAYSLPTPPKGPYLEPALNAWHTALEQELPQ